MRTPRPEANPHASSLVESAEKPIQPKIIRSWHERHALVVSGAKCFPGSPRHGSQPSTLPFIPHSAGKPLNRVCIAIPRLPGPSVIGNGGISVSTALKH